MLVEVATFQVTPSEDIAFSSANKTIYSCACNHRESHTHMQSKWEDKWSWESVSAYSFCAEEQRVDKHELMSLFFSLCKAWYNPPTLYTNLNHHNKPAHTCTHWLGASLFSFSFGNVRLMLLSATNMTQIRSHCVCACVCACTHRLQQNHMKSSGSEGNKLEQQKHSPS